LGRVQADYFQFVFYLLGDDGDFLVDEYVAALEGYADLAQAVLVQAFVLLQDVLIVHSLSAGFDHGFHLLALSHQVVSYPDVIVLFQL